MRSTGFDNRHHTHLMLAQTVNCVGIEARQGERDECDLSAIRGSNREQIGHVEAPPAQVEIRRRLHMLQCS